MRPRPRAPHAYPRFPPCRIVHRRGRACVPCTSTPRRPATQSPAARPTHQPRAALPSRGAGAAPRGAPGASALASSARVRRPELVPVRRPTGVGRPGGWVWVGVLVLCILTVHSDRVNRRRRRAEIPPPLPGAGSCRRRGRRHLPLRQPPDLFVGRSVRASSTPYPLGSYGRGGFRGAHSLPARVLRPCTALSPTLLHFFPATNLGIRHRRPHPRSRDEDGTPRLPSPEPHPFNRQAGRACHLLDRLHPRPRSGVLLGICFGSHVQYGISKSLCSARVRMSD